MLQNKHYVPLLKTGIAEVGAYRSLFPDVKTLSFPIFHLRPWPNAKHLQLAIERVKEAAEAFPFGLALDFERRNHTSAQPAQEEFNALFSEDQGFAAYYDLVSNLTEAVPVLLPTSSLDNMALQFNNADEVGHGFIIHERRGLPNNIWEQLSSLPAVPHDTIVVIDAGWSRDYLALEAWALPIVQNAINLLPGAEVVVMSSSFPDDFTHIVGYREEMASERRLFLAMRQRFQQADLTYGDWGSTRPTGGGGGGNSIPSRVDIATTNSWHIFRADPDNDLGFSEMAWDAQHHECFPLAPDCWGKQLIAVTTDEEGITSRQSATQVRINIHLTVQSGAASTPPTDEIPYVD